MVERCDPDNSRSIQCNDDMEIDKWLESKTFSIEIIDQKVNFETSDPEPVIQNESSSSDGV